MTLGKNSYQIADIVLTKDGVDFSVYTDYIKAVKPTWIHWNLKETLDNQSDETKLFLIDLLCTPA